MTTSRQFGGSKQPRPAGEQLFALRSRGVVFSLALTDRIIFDAPAGALNDPDVDKLRAVKAELVNLLKQELTEEPLSPHPSSGSPAEFAAATDQTDPGDLDDFEAYTNEFGLPGIRRRGFEWPDLPEIDAAEYFGLRNRQERKT